LNEAVRVEGIFHLQFICLVYTIDKDSKATDILEKAYIQIVFTFILKIISHLPHILLSAYL